ncbi:hypothetical protein HU200_019328 [Digitaria exilis]|uniref:Uncharacterized protein n=1 Tax=Digitaria exilis TaxID=1010633 RepID=A0A835F2W3_9POAL|nr:hypothetical protein HU200_019328 [Digitaria exilis]
MVKLATAREARLYGPGLTVRRMNAFAALLLAASLAARAAVAVALAAVAAVNAHDLAAHLAGVDWLVGLADGAVRLPAGQLGLVESSLCRRWRCSVRAGAGYISYGREKHAANMLLAAALLWLLGSVLNSCQVCCLLQSSVQVLNRRRVSGSRGREPAVLVVRKPLERSARTMNARDSTSRPLVWLCMLGSLLWLAAALLNALKVFMMHQSDGMRLEKLCGGVQEDASRSTGRRRPGGGRCQLNSGDPPHPRGATALAEQLRQPKLEVL